MPEGRLINNSLFVRDIYTNPTTGAEGKPKYNVEMAYDPGQITGQGTIEDEFLAMLEDEFGKTYTDPKGKTVSMEDAFLDGLLNSPIIFGDKLAADREARGKKGDAYKGKLVIRASTLYNKDGQEDVGGAVVLGPDAKPIDAVNKGQVWNGCFGIIGVTLSTWKDQKGVPGVKCFLVGFQKTKDGDKLTTTSDHSNLFKPIGRPEGAAPARSRRAG